MIIGYARVSKSDGSQNLDFQVDALKAHMVYQKTIYIVTTLLVRKMSGQVCNLAKKHSDRVMF